MSAPAASSAIAWGVLPAELRLAVQDRLPVADIRALALVDKQSHELCLPHLFRMVHVRSMDQLRAFLKRVPRAHCRHIRDLWISTKPDAPVDAWCSTDDGDRGTTQLTALLGACEKLETLALRLWGSPAPSVVASFKHLDRLRTLSIGNAAPDEHLLLSERLAVGIAFTIPHLTSLSLSGIARSLTFAPDLLGSFPFVPVADDVALVYPVSSAAKLRLPSLLQLPYLQSLSIRDTHLSDPLWGTADVRAPLHTFELGACAQEAPDASQAHTDRILAHPDIAGCPTLAALALSTPLGPPGPAPGPKRTDKRFAALTALRIDPHFPLYAPAPGVGAGRGEDAEASPLARTLGALSASPISSVRIRCFGDDVPDVCAELAAVLRARGTPPAASTHEQPFFGALEEVGVQVLCDGGADEEDDGRADPPFEDEEGCVEVLRACCGAVRLAGVLAVAGAAERAAPGPSSLVAGGPQQLAKTVLVC